MKVYEIQYSVWMKDGIAFVKTVDAGKAIALLKEYEPTAEVWKCTHRGDNGIVITDPQAS